MTRSSALVKRVRHPGQMLAQFAARIPLDDVVRLGGEHQNYALSPGEVADGLLLTCQALPLGSGS